MNVSPPVCATCGKPLRTLQRRGQHWYCSVCGPRREPCAACGHTRPVTYRDRHGAPRCGGCPPDGAQDPAGVIVELVTGIDPTLPTDVVAAAVSAAVSRPAQRHQLAWALSDRPELLTGAGAEAPVPSVLRLIELLCAAGASSIARPPCPHCRRVIPLVKPRNGVRLCRNCVAKSRAEPCSGCGAIREAATRDEHGRPLCPNCLITDPANQETCTDCGRQRRVGARTPDGPLCESCRPWKTLTCAICGDHGPCVISQTTGEPWCRACKQRWARCAGCRHVAPVRGGTVDEPLCATCTRPDPKFWRSCSGCGQPSRLRVGRCTRCRLDQRLRELLGDDTGEIRPELQALHQALAATERPATVTTWLDRSTAPAILRGLQTDGAQITHQTLDELPASRPLEHLRSVLVAIGTLAPRDEQMVRLQRWITDTIAEQPDPDQRQLLHRYAVWHLLRRLRRRVEDADTTHGQTMVVRQHVKAAITVLDWLTAHNLTLAAARQGDIETWLAEDATHRRQAGHFVRWARQQKLTALDVAAIRWGGPTRVIDTEARWEQARRLLDDDAIAPEDRVAGLLVLLYAQWPAVISRLTLDHLDDSGHEVRLRLGREPVLLPEPLAALVRQIVAARRGHAAIGDRGTSPWMFPGGQPGRPISAHQLGERLRRLGLRPGQARSTALFQLATDLPAALLARMLGIHISVAVAWQRASAGDWMNYAAEVSRRNHAYIDPPTRVSVDGIGERRAHDHG